MNRSQWPLLLAALVFGGVVTLLYLLRTANPVPEDQPVPAVVERVAQEPPEPEPEPIPALGPDPVDNSVEGIVVPEAPKAGVRSASADRLMKQIGEALAAGDLTAFDRLVGTAALTEEARTRLAALAASGKLKLGEKGIGEVGELELNAHGRWAYRLEGAEDGRDRILFDLKRKDGKWEVTQVVLPPGEGEPVPKAQLVDSLGIVDAFLQAALKQDFERAKEFVDSKQVSDAKIAGLCILFEEGDYQLRPKKPLRAMFQKDDTAGYLAHVLASDQSDAAQFSITARKDPDPGNWQLVEINLDQLLADYARRVAGGDVYYTPLVKNPKGGATLVLYFEFDDGSVTQRTERQLEIVAEILKTDPEKKLTISGHTDALGTEEYNDRLSSDRATSVKETLIRLGVAESQIQTIAKGQSQPRRPNFTESGEDNPTGRRANRRTEIYLDF
ncbi:MAG: OmpA family protein [Verrucomicrobiota bacterium]